MTISATGARPVINNDANLVVRLREDAYGTNIWVGANQPPRMLSQGAVYEGLSGSGPTMFTNNTLIGGIQVAGRRIVQGSSNGGAIAFRRGGTVTVPLSQQFSGAGSLSGIMLGRPLRSYLLQIPIRLTVLAAGGRFEICLTDADTGVAAGGTRAGVSWCVDTTVNGGRWTPRYRLVLAGALVAGTDSGQSSVNVDHLLGIRYTEGPTPRIEWLMDNVPVFTLSGDANMPQVGGGGTLEPGFMPCEAFSQHIGSIFQSGDALYEVRSIGV